MPRAVGPRA